jgi:phage terminase large subunit-like protein
MSDDLKRLLRDAVAAQRKKAKATPRKPAAPPPAPRPTQKTAKSPAKPTSQHVRAAESYVSSVISGKIPACRWVKLACERHRRDIASSVSNSFPYIFDREKAEKACRFLEKLPHVKGKWAARDPKTRLPQPMILELWQKFVICSIFGWVKKTTGKRRYHKARLYIPRKNGKSFFGAGIGLYMLTMDKEHGAEVYSGATSEKQAWEVFGPARQMTIADPRIAPGLRLTINAQSIVRELDNSKFIPVIGNPGDGASPHCAIIDEYHEHKTSNLVDTMETGMGARDQPLSLIISTAGSNIAGPCREDWKNCERILEGTPGFEDETTFAIIWAIDPEDQWDTLEALAKANPNWGVSINIDQMEAKLKTAKQRANQQSAFRTKHLNEWVAAKEAYFNIVQWQSLARPDIKPDDFKEFPCFIAGDLASKHDLVCQIILFCLPGKRYAVFGRYWLPEATLDLPENQHYRNWHITGNLEVAGDDVTDLQPFMDAAIDACKTYQVEEMPSDPNRAWGVYPAMVREGVPIVEYRNTVLTMSEPMKHLDSLIRSGAIIHNGDPILEWAIGNTLGKMDAKDNVYPRKENESSKIDPVVSLIMAIGRAMLKDDSPRGPIFAC